MTIEQQIAALTTATTDLLNVVNVKKATLDAAVSDANNAAIATAADRVQTGLDVATTLDYKEAAEVAAAASLTHSQTAETAAANAKTLFGSKQDTLVPGVTLKTINGASLLGAGDLSVSGPAGSSSVRVKAGADIGGHRVVTLDEQGRAVYASPALMRDVNRVLGLTMHAAVTDADIDVLRDGDAVEPSWSWDLSKPIYLGQDGTLVQQIAPESTFTLIVGFPISATKMYFSIGTSIINS